jgi:alpha-L-fucosidase 2
VWGFTDPGWEVSWGLNVTGGLWIASHMIEHFEYTQDKTFLAEKAFPILKQSAEFYLDYMTVEPISGNLTTGPSVSPENSFFTQNAKDGEQQLSLAPTVDIILIRDLFKFLIKAGCQLNTSAEFCSRLKDALEKLPPFKIGKKGQLQEWLEDYEESQPGHRHLSHTVALSRSDQITPRHSPALAESVRVTLANRQARTNLEDIEFTAALFGLNFARLNDGESALKHVGHLIGELSFENLLSYSKAGVAGAEKSIFVIDGNFGGAAVVGEMLLRSSNSEVDLLPALPSKWPSGFVRGLRARGNLEFDVEWDGGNLTAVTLKAFSPGRVKLYYKHYHVDLSFNILEVIQLSSSLELLSKV